MKRLSQRCRWPDAPPRAGACPLGLPLTLADVFARTLADVTGRPVAVWLELVEGWKLSNPATASRWTARLSQAESAALLDRFERERPEIRRWLSDGVEEALSCRSLYVEPFAAQLADDA